VTSTRSGSGWFLCEGAGTGLAEPSARIFCFPHAGGDPRGYLTWQHGLGSVATLVAVCMPGRGHRFAEPLPASIDELADGAAAAISGYLDRPVYLFGHSFGGLVAFEVARRLRDTHAVRHLVVSACAAASLLPTEYIVWASRLEWREFVATTAKYEGLAQEIVEDEELQRLLLPDLWADVRLLAEYRYRPAAPLPIGASLINAVDDWRVAGGVLQPWEREFAAEPEHHWREGGHFYFSDRPSAVVDVLRAVVLREAAAEVPADQHVEVI
jgi:surfactin synthase thioesterase subunit